MFTQSAPAIINALSGVLPDNAIKALTQALGNCGQPLAHRGDLSLTPTVRQDGPGYIEGGRWNVNNYIELLEGGTTVNIDLPGWGTTYYGDTNNYLGDSFHFPINQEFTNNNYFGGPNIYNGGDIQYNNSFSNVNNANTTNTTNLNVTNINGIPLAGPAGPPGRDGAAGAAGRDGADGLNALNLFGARYALDTKLYQIDYLSGRPRLTPVQVQGISTTVRIPTGIACDEETGEPSLILGDPQSVLTDVAVSVQPEIRGVQPKFRWVVGEAALRGIN